jgi:hypothetical protein
MRQLHSAFAGHASSGGGLVAARWMTRTLAFFSFLCAGLFAVVLCRNNPLTIEPNTVLSQTPRFDPAWPVLWLAQMRDVVPTAVDHQ